MNLAVQVLVKLLHDLLEALQVVLHIVLGHDQAQVELGEGRLQKLVVHLPDHHSIDIDDIHQHKIYFGAYIGNPTITDDIIFKLSMV